MPKKNLNARFPTLLGFALSFLISGCGARVTITDTEWCADAGPRGAFCFHTLSDTQRRIPVEDWAEQRFGKICTDPETLAEWKAAILKLCDDTGRCDFRMEEAVQAFSHRVDRASRDAQWTRF